jgi:hypothetical protein
VSLTLQFASSESAASYALAHNNFLGNAVANESRIRAVVDG